MSDPVYAALAETTRMPPSALATWRDFLATPMQAAGLTTPDRIGAFIGQCAYESARFTRLSEDMTYRTALAICRTWPARFPAVASAAPYVCAPIKLANTVYAGRMGNGDAESGDGWRFRGAGLIALTGRENFAAFGETCGRSAEDAADWCRTPAGAAAAAVWFWGRIAGNALADAWAVSALTRAINGGMNGAAERQKLCNAARAAAAKSC